MEQSLDFTKEEREARDEEKTKNQDDLVEVDKLQKKGKQEKHVVIALI